MKLVPVYEEKDNEEGAVKISPSIVNNMGVRVATVKKDMLSQRIDTVAYIEYNENKIYHVHMRAKGWVQTLKANTEGMRVKKGDLLFEYYSPELVNIQQEYIQSLALGNKGLIRASIDRMRAMDIPVEHINKLRKTKRVSQLIKVRATQDGVVSKLRVRQGMHVKPNKEVMTIANLSSVWVQAEVFGVQANLIKVGQQAILRVHDLQHLDDWKDGKKVTVDYIYPNVDQKTRTLRVRFHLDNAKELLKPNMYAHITIQGGDIRKVLLIPTSALIRVTDGQRVIVSLGKGRFKPQAVKIGVESGNNVEILSGLQQGDKVVISGQFLIDSEASSLASLTRMKEIKPDKEKAKEKHDRKKKNMSEINMKKSADRSEEHTSELQSH